jgi:NAD-dependent SIR2 family protein deacetylase
MSASEYVDTEDVLAAKVDLLARKVEASASLAVYAGAGLSTAAGIKDYASRAAGSVAIGKGAADCGASEHRFLKPTVWG